MTKRDKLREFHVTNVSRYFVKSVRAPLNTVYNMRLVSVHLDTNFRAETIIVR